MVSKDVSVCMHPFVGSLLRIVMSVLLGYEKGDSSSWKLLGDVISTITCHYVKILTDIRCSNIVPEGPTQLYSNHGIKTLRQPHLDVPGTVEKVSWSSTVPDYIVNNPLRKHLVRYSVVDTAGSRRSSRDVQG
jgi:hypothetical protein